MTQSQIKVLSIIYRATDCSNEVYDYASLHHKQEKIAMAMPAFVSWIDNCYTVDGDGFMADPERIGKGFRLTPAGYEELTRHDPQAYPVENRRFAGGAQ